MKRVTTEERKRERAREGEKELKSQTGRENNSAELNGGKGNSNKLTEICRDRDSEDGV